MRLAIISFAALATLVAAQDQVAAQQRNGGGGGGRGGQGNNTGGGNPQTSLVLDPSQVQKGLAKDGQEQPTAGQAASLTSTNNFMNFCLTRPELALTDGKQVVEGSCNPTPMGIIIAQSKMPSAKFQSPKNFQTIPPNQDFDIVLKIKNMQLGAFVNPQTNYYGAPGQTNADGVAIGHSHFTVERLSSIDSTEILDNTKPAFFNGINGAADAEGNVKTTVTGGLPEGDYRLTSINTYSNHQPILAAVANRGSLDDTIYFSVRINTDQSEDGGAGDEGVDDATPDSALPSIGEQPGAAQPSTTTQPAATQPGTQPTTTKPASGQRDGRRTHNRFEQGRRRQGQGGFQRAQRRAHTEGH